MADELFPIDNSPIGAAGTLIAAGLEYAGHYLQSSLLDVFASGPAVSIGGFLFTLSCIVGIFLIATGGHYKFGIYLLVGPAIFYWLMFDRVVSTGVSWQSGERLHTYEKTERVTRDVTPEGYVVRVSRFFAWWDWFTSGTTQTFTTALELVGPDSDLHFLQTSQKYASLFGLRVQNKELQQFVDLVMLDPRCVSLYGLQFLRERRNSEIVDITALDDKITKLGLDKVINQSSSNWGYLTRLINNGAFGAKTADIADEVELLKDDGLTCMDLWEFAIEAMMVEGGDLVNLLAVEDPHDQLTRSEVLSKLSRKFQGNVPAGQAPPSPEVQIESMIRAVAARMAFNAVRKSSPNTFQMFIDDPVKNQPANGTELRPLAEELRLHTEAAEGRPKGEYLSAMLAMPYIQGVGFYFLAISYPFFCFCLIVPGRHHAFLLWMGLWFWLKSWDFGFAAVMRLDELLYHLLPSGPMIDETEITNPGEAFKIILQEDPIYTIHTYYLILAMMLAAVPLLSGILVKKGGGEVLDAVSQGVRNFAGRIGGAMEAHQRSGMSSGAIKKGQLELARLGEQAQKEAINDPKIQQLRAIYRHQVLAGRGNSSALQNWANTEGKSALGNSAKGALNQVLGGAVEANKKANEQYFKQLIHAEYQAIWHEKLWDHITSNPEYRNHYNNAIFLGNANHRLWEGYLGEMSKSMVEDRIIAKARFRAHGFADTGAGLVSGGAKKSVNNAMRYLYGK